MHYGYWGFPGMGAAYGMLGWVWPILFWIVIAIVITKMIRQPKEGREQREESSRQTPLEILKGRYVKGEISKKEFEEMKKDIA
jgi:putative membrane protein